MATERFAGILLVMLQKHSVNVEETDSMVIRLNIDQLVDLGLLAVDDMRGRISRADETTPLVLELSQDPDDTNLALSLFQTCPEFPTHYALDGTLQITSLTLARDPEDTGRQEHLAGTVTATLTRANAEGRVGTTRAEFDFAPPRRPLTDFK